MNRVTANVELITPEFAEMLLRNAKVQEIGKIRNATRRHIDSLADLMVRRRFYCGIDSLCFDTNNNLLNGIHRLNAVVQSGVSVYMVVVRNMEPAAIMYFDRGRQRSLEVVSRIPEYYLKCYTFLLDYFTGAPRKKDPQDMINIDSKLRQYVENLSLTNRKFFSSRPVKSAALVSLVVNPQDTDYILNSYEYLVNNELTYASRIIKEFNNNSNHLFGTSWGLCNHAFINAMYAFDKSNENHKHINPDATYIDLCHVLVKNLMLSINL